jgi:type II secretory pathway pseudopilin PulG
MSPSHRHADLDAPAFSLTEMVAVIAVVVILLMLGAGLLPGNGTQARKAGTDLLASLIEQARTTAITSRTHVVLAIAEPGDLPENNTQCRVGLIGVDQWPDALKDTLKGVLLTRWFALDTGIALIGGEVDGMANPLDEAELTIACGTTRLSKLTVHALAFNEGGVLAYPAGAAPVAMRVAEGGYRGGAAMPYRRGASGVIRESRLKIGRVTARSYRIDG